MNIDPMKAARLHRHLREMANQLQAHHIHIAHTIQPNERHDTSLTHRLKYHNRADWYATAAMSGFCDVDLPAKTVAHRFLTAAQISQIAHPKRHNGMSLYE